MVGLRTTLIITIGLLLSGCAGIDSDIHGNGTTRATETSQENCSDGEGHIRISTNGSGKIVITVTDGAGVPIYTKNVDGTGQVHDDKEISGAAGTWTLTAKFGGGTSYGMEEGFTGQWSIGLSC